MYTYKHLTNADVALLRDLLRVFGEAFEDVPTYQDAVPSDAYLHALLSKPHFIVIVAMAGDEVVGGLAGYELDKFERERREMFIYDLAVAEPHRRRGIGRGLLQVAQRLAKERGAYVVFIQADEGDEPAIRLYESMGRMERALHFDIPVGE